MPTTYGSLSRSAVEEHCAEETTFHGDDESSDFATLLTGEQSDWVHLQTGQS